MLRPRSYAIIHEPVALVATRMVSFALDNNPLTSNHAGAPKGVAVFHPTSLNDGLLLHRHSE